MEKFERISVDRCTNPMSQIMDKALDKGKRMSQLKVQEKMQEIGSNREMYKEYEETGELQEDNFEKALTNLMNEEKKFEFSDEED